MLKIIVLIFLLIPGLFLYPQLKDAKFERLSLEEGLSHHTVFCMLQDQKGFLWVGTADGLNKFDGYQFQVYRHDPENPHSISDNYILSLEEDAKGNIWIGTLGGGLNHYSYEADRFIRYLAKGGENSLSHNSVQVVFEAKKDPGIMWIGTLGGLNRLDTQTGQFTQFQNNPQDIRSLSHNEVRCIYQDHLGGLWIGTSGGLNKLNKNTGKFVQYRKDSSIPHSLSNDYVTAICEDRNHQLWIGTYGGGLNKMVKESGEFIHFRSNPDLRNTLSNDSILSIYESKQEEGILWIGTIGGGLNRFDTQKGNFTHWETDDGKEYSLSSNDISSVIEDSSGIIWIGTYEGGLNKYVFNREKFSLFQTDDTNTNSLSHNFINCMLEDHDGILWIGTLEGLNRLDRNNHRVMRYKHETGNSNGLISNNIKTIIQDKTGYFWLGTSAGLSRQVKGKGGQLQFRHYQNDPVNPNSLSHNSVSVIYEDKSGGLWIGTSGGGMNRFVPEAESFTRYVANPNHPNNINHNEILDITEDAYGMIWVATGDGICQFDRGKEIFKSYKSDPDQPGSLSHNTTWCIHVTGDGQLYVATSGGLDRFNPDSGTFTHFNARQGLCSNIVYGILEDSEKNLWLSTNKGLSKFSPDQPVGKKFKNYDVKDGLQGYEFNPGAFYKSISGEMFFGGINGLNAFYPPEIKDNPHVPPIYITSFKIHNRMVKKKDDSPIQKHMAEVDSVTLSYKDYDIAFEFVALDFQTPEKNQYAYKLEGYKDEWVFLGTKRDINFTSLEPGDYVFVVKGSNNDGIWNESGARLLIQMTPPFWRTWWFKLFIALGLIGLAVGLHQLRVYNIKVQNRKLEEQVQQRTHEIMSQKEIIEEKSNQIISSIHYAKRIQSSILPESHTIQKCLPEYFIIFDPKSIVSGDFYWFSCVDDKVFIAVVDCTGHGVPGAFMSLIGNSILNQIVNESRLTDPSDILENLDYHVRAALERESGETDTNDGMEICLCVIDKNKVGIKESGHKYKINFAGAKRPLFLVRPHSETDEDYEFFEFKGDRRAIGGHKTKKLKSFTNQKITVHSGDMIYLTSDGFPDQQNQEERKYGIRRFKLFLQAIADLKPSEQKSELQKELRNHQDGFEQQDDITVLGIRL